MRVPGITGPVGHRGERYSRQYCDFTNRSGRLQAVKRTKGKSTFIDGAGGARVATQVPPLAMGHSANTVTVSGVRVPPFETEKWRKTSQPPSTLTPADVRWGARIVAASHAHIRPRSRVRGHDPRGNEILTQVLIENGVTRCGTWLNVSNAAGFSRAVHRGSFGSGACVGEDNGGILRGAKAVSPCSIDLAMSHLTLRSTDRAMWALGCWGGGGISQQ